jgi:hypothetical protein
MKAILRIAAGVAVGTGLVALAGANLRAHDDPAAAAATPVAPAAAPPPAAPAIAPPSLAEAVPPPEPAAWREQVRAPAAVPPGVLARVARRAADRAAACPPAPAPAAGGSPAPRAPAAGVPARCTKGHLDVEIDWNGAPSSTR